MRQVAQRDAPGAIHVLLCVKGGIHHMQIEKEMMEWEDTGTSGFASSYCIQGHVIRDQVVCHLNVRGRASLLLANGVISNVGGRRWKMVTDKACGSAINTLNGEVLC